MGSTQVLTGWTMLELEREYNIVVRIMVWMNWPAVVIVSDLGPLKVGIIHEY
jgi:hypothetical protein